jgi:hypothetical protein
VGGRSPAAARRLVHQSWTGDAARFKSAGDDELGSRAVLCAGRERRALMFSGVIHDVYGPVICENLRPFIAANDLAVLQGPRTASGTIAFSLLRSGHPERKGGKENEMCDLTWEERSIW